MQVEEHYIKELIREREGAKLDFKYHVGEARKIAKTLVSFANTRGGTLLLGVKDNGKIIGVTSEEEAYMIDTAARYFCDPYVEYEIVDWEIDGKTVLEVKVEKGSSKPYYAKDENDKWGVYVRVEDNNKFANRIVVQYLKRLNRKKRTYLRYSMNEKILLNYLNKNNKISLNEFRHLVHLSKRKSENIFINLVSLGVVVINHNGKDFYYTLEEGQKEPVF